MPALLDHALALLAAGGRCASDVAAVGAGKATEGRRRGGGEGAAVAVLGREEGIDTDDGRGCWQVLSGLRMIGSPGGTRYRPTASISCPAQRTHAPASRGLRGDVSDW